MRTSAAGAGCVALLLTFAIWLEGDNMPRYWVIAPFDYSRRELWEQVWQKDLALGIISVGWREVGDVSSLDRKALREVVERTYRSAHPARMLWDFLHEIQPGDVILARRGRKILAAVGTVTRGAFHDDELAIQISGPEYFYPRHLGVRWHPEPRDKVFDRIVFGMQTLNKMSEERYLAMIEEEEPTDPAVPTTA
jgi:restriction system protein